VFYILLIIPHVAAIGGMLWWAFRQTDLGGEGGTYGDNWWGEWHDPDEPSPVPPHGPATLGPPLPDGRQPIPRLRPGEQLAERSLPVPRRDPEHPAPTRRPVPTQD
jgi:hypothetical protein